MIKQSAGILLYRIKNKVPQVFLVHPGGPFWARKDLGAWTIPKGEYNEGEEPLDAALREFEEETGTKLKGKTIALTAIRQKAGKTVHCWAVKGDINPATLVSNTFEMEWPPRSGHQKTFPEVDKGDWFTLPIAREKINVRQVAFINELEKLLFSLRPEPR
jgi:predicted NUDIX family NTP pyrophosphohydrolase